MSSKCSVRVVSILPSLHLLPLFLCLIYGVEGATLREHRLSEPGSYEPGSQLRPSPSDEMLQALRYIQSLSQRTPSEPSADDHQPATADLEPDDMESVRSILRLASPARGSTGMDRDLEESKNENDKKWLQAVLTTLQQTEEQMVPQKTPQKMSWKTHTSSPSRYPIQSLQRPNQQQEETSSTENYERTSWANPGSRRRQRQYPLMYEKDEEDQDQPLKRTNENAEEQYTPQKLATLQSVFEELSGISTSKTNNRRESTADTTTDDDDDDLYRQRKMALEDIMGTDEWEPLEEQTETEEEQRERHGFNSNFDDNDYDQIFVKRSNQPDLFHTEKVGDLEDIAKLVDLLRKEQKREEVNEKKDTDEEEEEDDEEEDEEKDEEERDIKPMRGTFPQSLSQLIKISQKLQMPPADVLDLFQNDLRNFRIPPRNPAQSRTAPRTYTTNHDAHKTYATAPHHRPLLTSQSNTAAQDILSILELVSAAQLTDKLPRRPLQPKPLRYYERERDIPGYGFPETIRDDYDDTTGDEDELTGFLASEMLGQGQRRERQAPSLDEQQYAYDNLEHAIQDYLDKNVPEQRPVEHKSTPTSLDDDRMMRILRYLEPESDDTDDTDSEGKTVPEM